MPAKHRRLDKLAYELFQAHGVRFGSRLCEKSVVQFVCRTSISISSMRKPIALATSVERRQLRKQFCTFLASARFHTAWVDRLTLIVGRSLPVLPQ
jgi:hypothetical protein